jgi:OOP family OmpA-OmpF porin
MMLKQLSGLSLAALMAITLASAAHAEDGKYVQNSAGEAVKNSAGECVLAIFGSSPEGCEAAPVAPPAVVAPPPVRAPVRAPAPYVPKVKVKGNYKGAVNMDSSSKATLKRYQK